MIDENLLSDFIEHRKAIKKPMSPIAIKRLTNKLDRYEAQGLCPNLLLERSIINGWQDIYPDDSCRKNQLRSVKTSDVGFVDLHTNKNWRKGVGFIENHTDKKWREGL